MMIEFLLFVNSLMIDRVTTLLLDFPLALLSAHQMLHESGWLSNPAEAVLAFRLGGILATTCVPIDLAGGLPFCDTPRSILLADITDAQTPWMALQAHHLLPIRAM